MNKALEQNILSLANSLKKKGLEKEAISLEDKLFTFKMAAVHLYKVFEEEGKDVIDFAHSDGDVKMIDSNSGDGVVETVLTIHDKVLSVLNKQPTGKNAQFIESIIKSAEFVLNADDKLDKYKDVDWLLKQSKTDLARLLKNIEILVSSKGFQISWGNISGEKDISPYFVNDIYNFLYDQLANVGKDSKTYYEAIKNYLLSEVNNKMHENSLGRYIDLLEIWHDIASGEGTKINFGPEIKDAELKPAVLEQKKNPSGVQLTEESFSNILEKLDDAEEMLRLRVKVPTDPRIVKFNKNPDKIVNILNKKLRVVKNLKIKINEFLKNNNSFNFNDFIAFLNSKFKDHFSNVKNISMLEESIDKFLAKIGGFLETIKYAGDSFIEIFVKSAQAVPAKPGKSGLPPPPPDTTIPATYKKTTAPGVPHPANTIVPHTSGNGSVYEMQLELKNLSVALKAAQITGADLIGVTGAAPGVSDGLWGPITDAAILKAEDYRKTLSAFKEPLKTERSEENAKYNTSILKEMTASVSGGKGKSQVLDEIYDYIAPVLGISEDTVSVNGINAKKGGVPLKTVNLYSLYDIVSFLENNNIIKAAPADINREKAFLTNDIDQALRNLYKRAAYYYTSEADRSKFDRYMKLVKTLHDSFIRILQQKSRNKELNGFITELELSAADFENKGNLRGNSRDRRDPNDRGNSGRDERDPNGYQINLANSDSGQSIIGNYPFTGSHLEDIDLNNPIWVRYGEGLSEYKMPLILQNFERIDVNDLASRLSRHYDQEKYDSFLKDNGYFSDVKPNDYQKIRSENYSKYKMRQLPDFLNNLENSINAVVNSWDEEYSQYGKNIFEKRRKASATSDSWMKAIRTLRAKISW